MKSNTSSLVHDLLLVVFALMLIAIGAVSLTVEFGRPEVVRATGERAVARAPVECRPHLVSQGEVLESVSKVVRAQGDVFVSSGVALALLAGLSVWERRRKQTAERNYRSAQFG